MIHVCRGQLHYGDWGRVWENNEDCDPGPTSERSGYVIGGAASCADPEFGGEYGRWKTCNRVWVDENGEPDFEGEEEFTAWRCSCHPLMALIGEDCGEVGELQVGALLVGFGAVALLFLYTFLRGLWLVYYMLRLSNGRLNSALHEFDLYINASLGVTIVSLAEGLMSLGLAWISVAEKSKRLRTKSSKRLNRMKWGTRVFMVCLAVVVFGFMWDDRAIDTAYIGMALCIILLPVLVYGGRQLRLLFGQKSAAENATTTGKTRERLSTGTMERTTMDAPPSRKITNIVRRRKSAAEREQVVHYDLNTVTKQTYLGIAAWMITFVFSAFWMFRTVDGINNTGVTRWEGTEGTACFTALGVSIWGTMWTVLSFFFKANTKSITKLKQRDAGRVPMTEITNVMQANKTVTGAERKWTKTADEIDEEDDVEKGAVVI
ncbi:hypothetical protein TeGR_g4318 [Tetraparma gracilis]|uniref:Uncharacterized protein n=1 Tax=Tetraparma gracilis TaxID=2962635 RepID=A0ABQ6M4C8_9STRA|nr:hypothetical protein TeGR_g4318 [Tetraparma gracilis]